ncbi:Purple acid phosphatase 18 [Chlorella sorokiniana]|uniref:Purple acid phosphatase n=1 Tax=Chlorella sorokiniana TaxID=3076 RepID=A0A2P6TB37_CHLSO|nr:Purple acid phosphatase 18 [Chlorella sorokiniana]|eukprot:PRW05763.1 Purple acid phosphatase 18 [Chlorella sorokiniana]
MSLNELPDELLLHIFEALREVDPWSWDNKLYTAVPLVCRRWRSLTLSPQLLCKLSIDLHIMRRADLLPRLRSLCVWMACAAGHIRSLYLNLVFINPLRADQGEVEGLLAELQDMGSYVPSQLDCRSLTRLRLLCISLSQAEAGDYEPLWNLPALERLSLASCLQLPACLGRLAALRVLSISDSPMLEYDFELAEEEQDPSSDELQRQRAAALQQALSGLSAAQLTQLALATNYPADCSQALMRLPAAMAQRLLLAALCLAVAWGPAPTARAQVSYSSLYHRPAERPALALDHARLARSPQSNAHSPEQVHLAFAGPGAYAVTWVTYPLDRPRLDSSAEQQAGAAAGTARRLAAAPGSQQQQLMAAASDAAGRLDRRRKDRCAPVVQAGGKSVVQYGTASGDYQHTVESPDPPACYSSGNYVSGAIHRVIFGAGYEGPLPYNNTIFYRVGDPTRGWSDEFSFRTAPLVGLDALPYRLGLVGDLGQTDHSLSTLEHMVATNADSVILTGDLSYADGYQPRWDTWGRLVAPHTSRQVWMYCVGNHEIELTDGVKDFLSYTTRFYCPYRHSLSESPLYYSYDVAGAHVIMLSSYSPYSRDSEQYAWLLRDLASVDRARTPWLVVSFHAPWYNSNYAHQGEGEEMRKAMEPVLYEHGVDFVFCGHVHAYERHHRVFDNRLDHCAPIHINIGDGGNKEGPDKKYYAQPKYSAYREPSFGHGTLDLLDATHAEWRWHRNQDDGPESADFVSVVRDPDCKSLRAERLAAWRANQAAAGSGGVQQAQQGQQQGQQERSTAWLEEQAEEQALILEREAEQRAATAAQRQHLSEEAEQQHGLWCGLSVDMLVLKHGWAPIFCENADRTGAFCGGTTPFGAFRLNRLAAKTFEGKDVTGCNDPAFTSSDVPQDLLPELNCVWNSYAVPNNNEQLWSSIWSEATEGGVCTGLSPSEWMRRAVQLRDQYNPDRAFKSAGIVEGGATTAAAITSAFSSAYGRNPHVACNKATTTASSSSSSSSSSDSGGGGGVNGAAIGAAVGIAIAVVAAAVIGFAFWRKKRRARLPRGPADTTGTLGFGGSPTRPHGPPAATATLGSLGSLGTVPTRPHGGPPMSLASMMEAGGGAGAAMAGGAAVVGAGGAAQAWQPLPDPGAGLPPPLPAQELDTFVRPGSSAMLGSASAATASAVLAQDPLMSYIYNSRVSVASRSSARTAGSGGGASSVRTPSSTGIDMHPWEIGFGELSILRPIGEGSFGRVYLANWRGVFVACKVLLMGGAGAADPQRALTLSSPVLNKLEEEASLLASLRHPNIVNFFGICHDPPCIVTEYAAYGSLAELLARARAEPAVAEALTWPRRLAMLITAATGMLYLHNRPAGAIVHRDLKSPNLLVDQAWNCKVTDFNLSRILEDTTQGSSMAAMNPRWLAPEVMQGQRATRASDVFSFSVVMWEMLTLDVPYGSGNPWQLVSHVLSGGRLDLPPPEALPGGSSPALQAGLPAYVALMKRCWAQAPEDRPAFDHIVQQLRVLLEQANGGEPAAEY